MENETLSCELTKSYGIVYVIWCLINSKPYVGQTTVAINKRWKRHIGKWCGCPKLQRAIEKYGSNNFCFSILKECKSKDELDVFEAYYQLTLNSIDDGYNIWFGPSGGRPPEEAIEKIRNKAIGRKHSDVSKKKMSETRKGKAVHSEQWKSELRDKFIKDNPSHHKEFFTSESRYKQGSSFRGKHLSEETKKKISKSNSDYSKFHMAGVYKLENKITGEIVIVDYGLTKFCSERGLDLRSIQRVRQGKYKHYKGWKIILIDRPNKKTEERGNETKK